MNNLLQASEAEMTGYAAVFEKTASGWCAYVPDLPGLTITGATLEETEHLICVAIDIHIAGLREHGLPVPPPATRVKHISIPA
jgi:predicted RNase H-like HicB family nuclease